MSYELIRNGVNMLSVKTDVDANSLTVNAELYFNPLAEQEAIDKRQKSLDSLLGLSVEDLDSHIESCKEIELKGIEEKLKKLIDRWAGEAYRIQLFQHAKELLQAAVPAEHTGNIWVEETPGFQELSRKTISNEVFCAAVWVGEDTISRRRNDYHTKRVYTAGYRVRSNLKTNQTIIAGVDRKVFDTKEEAEKYIKGRMAALEKEFFSCAKPPIPHKYRDIFLIKGDKILGIEYQAENDVT